jgi:hypothetical protein
MQCLVTVANSAVFGLFLGVIGASDSGNISSDLNTRANTSDSISLENLLLG